MPAPVVKCPTCNRDLVWNEQAKFRPFCSERCKTIDLGTWASGGYSIAGSATATDTTPDIAAGALKTPNH
jgi:endogenous inhibitor of DNA gyrase (YacG/DUF329 family)